MSESRWWRVARWCLTAALLSIAVVTYSTIYPFVVGKVIFFRTAVEFSLLFFFLGLATTDGTIRAAQVLKTPLVSAVTAFVFLFSLAGFLGYSPGLSFWSNYVRGEGVFQMWHYYAFFILLVILFRDEKSWRRLLWWSLTAGAAAVAVGIPAYLQNFQRDWRLGSAIGNSGFLGTYLLFAAFYLFWLMGNEERQPHQIGRLRRWWLWGGGLGIVLVLLALTGTRGAVLGLAAGAGAGLTHLFFVHSTNSTRRYSLLGLVLLMSAAAALFYWQPLRIFQISWKEQAAQTRLWTWGSALAGARERPWLGWGPENFSVVFDRHFDTRHYRGPGIFSEVWFDRAHNFFFDYLTTVGVVGLVSYLTLWGIMVYTTSRSSVVFHSYLSSLWLAFPVAYVTHGVFVFETLPAYLNLFLVLALANFSSRPATIPSALPKNHFPHQSSLIPFVSLVGCVILGISFYFGNYLPLRKAILFNQALARVPTLNSVEEFKNNFSPALQIYAPYGQDEVVRILGGVAMDLLKQQPSPDVGRAIADYVTDQYQVVIGRGPSFAQNYYILGKVNELAGKHLMAQRYYGEGLEQWPRRPEFKDGLARVRLIPGGTGETLQPR